MENMKTTLTKMQKLQVKPVPKQTIDADVSSSPISTKKHKIKISRPPSVKSDKLSRGSVDFNLDNDTVEESLMAAVDPLREHIYVDHTIPTRPSSKPSRVQKYFEKYKKSNGEPKYDYNNDDNNISNNTNDDDKKAIKNKHHQFIKGDWPDSIEVSTDNNNNNNNNDDNNDKDDITITSSNISGSIIHNIWQQHNST
jgi:hypothetical protein